MEHFQGRNSITLDEDFSMPETPPGTTRLDLACGQQKRKGFIGIDIQSELADIHHDLTIYPWPFEDNSVYEVNCSHYVEHIKDLEGFMKELYRIMVPLGIATITGPYYTSIRATQDYTHCRFLSELTMKYFDQPWLKIALLDKIYLHGVDFETINTIFLYTNEWASRSEEAKMWALKHYMNVVDDIMFVLRAHKPIR